MFGLTGKEVQQLEQGEADPVSKGPNLAVFSGPATQISLALASTPSQAGPQEAADWPLDTLPLKLMSVTSGRLALFLIEILLCPVAPSLTRSWPGPDNMQPLSPAQPFPEPEVRAEFRGWGKCMFSCMHSCL